jgi:hypothetical protein
MTGPQLGHDSIIQPPPMNICDLFHWEKDSPPMERPVEGPLDEIAALKERVRHSEEGRDTLLMRIRAAARELEL